MTNWYRFNSYGGNFNKSEEISTSPVIVLYSYLATAQPRHCALKFLSCCMKSELSMRAMSAKWRSHRICKEKHVLIWK